jgi:hypothetical protein
MSFPPRQPAGQSQVRDTSSFTTDEEKRAWDEGLKDGILLGLREGMLVTLRSIRDMDWHTHSGPNDFMAEVRDEIKLGHLTRKYSEDGETWVESIGEIRSKYPKAPRVNSISVGVQSCS